VTGDPIHARYALRLMPPPFRVLFLADIQMGMYATFSGLSEDGVADYAARGMTVRAVPPAEGHEWEARQYQRAIEAANALQPDLVLFGGDLVDDPNAEDQLDEYLRITSLLDPGIERRWAPGNHDIGADTVIPTDESIARYREVFGDDYYAFDAGPATFLILDTVVIDHPENVAAEWESQRQFVLDRLDGSDGRPIIVAGHHPFFVDHAAEDDTYWNLPRERRDPLLTAFHGAGVRLVLGAHLHKNAHAADGDLEMVTSGPVGYTLGPDPSGMTLVEIDEDGGATHRYLTLEE
jgi:serine/threonine-protein phosphatase CPPED1